MSSYSSSTDFLSLRETSDRPTLRHRPCGGTLNIDDDVMVQETENINFQPHNDEEDRDDVSSSTDGEDLCEALDEISNADTMTRKIFTQWEFGEPTKICCFCNAIVWYEERNIKSKNPTSPRFSICCQNGKVQLPMLQDPSSFLKQLLDYEGGSRSLRFRANIRVYNSMFTFTSMGGQIDNKINDGRGRYIFRIQGQNHHMIGSLLPVIGQKPKFAQLYIYDTDNEISNRLTSLNRNVSSFDPCIVEDLLNMLDEHNELTKVFRMARDRFRESDIIPIHIRILGTRQRDGRQFNLPTSSEVAALIVGDGMNIDSHRDIVVEDRASKLRRINELHPSFMAMQYPILFPYGEDGFTVNILQRHVEGGSVFKRASISMREFYAFWVQQRSFEGQTLLRGGRLFQQYLVDAYACIQETRLQWLRNNQKKIRSDLYKGLSDAVVAGDTTAASVGKRFVLPSSFTGGPRYMVQNYQDAIAICRWAGPPNLFLTFTCNPKWTEIQTFLQVIPGQKVEDRPDIVTRVFKIKLDQLMKDLRHEKHFGEVIAAIYTVEFQKRGLPHAHILLFLHPRHRPSTSIDIDKIISAELPDKIKDPLAYEAIVKFMIHGPCGNLNSRSPCMLNGKCSKHYPKQFFQNTTIDQGGYPVYRRRNDGRTALKNSNDLDNRWVIPYNTDLVVKYHTHINESCNQTRAVKYLFKYINKGQDRATVVIEENLTVDDTRSGTQVIRNVDEIKTYLDCRYISTSEASWRIFNFDIQFRTPSVERLSYHLPDEQVVIFNDDEDLVDVINKFGVEKTMFTEWMHSNSLNHDARDLTYVDFPTRWVWQNKNKKWSRRKSGLKIGRIYYAHPTSGERFYLRMLLNIVKGLRCFEDIKTIDGIVHPTFKSACYALGLLNDDKEWDESIEEAGHWASGQVLREMFVTLMQFCEITDISVLWNKHWRILSDDILHRQQRLLNDEELLLSDDQLKNFALFEIEKLLNQSNMSLRDFPGLPFPDLSFHVEVKNRLIREELRYDCEESGLQFIELQRHLNADQAKVFSAVISSVDNNSGGMFFVYGSGGTGKTYLWNTIISRMRSNGKIVLAVASSGIAALLLPGGRTAHSRFKIPIILNDESCCNITKQSLLAELIRKTHLIIWDEAPMNHKNAFEAVDRTFRDLMHFSSGNNSSNKVFGGKTFVLGGDFRQVLPVIPKGRRELIVASSISRSYLWDECHVFLLTMNMRLRQRQVDSSNISSIVNFSKWVLDLGNGNLPAISIEDGEEANWIKIPDKFLIQFDGDSIGSIVSCIYDDLLERYKEGEYLQKRGILAPTNKCVDEVNSYIISLISGDTVTYLSADTIR